MLSGSKCQYCGLWALEPCENAVKAAACGPDDDDDE